MSTQSHILVVEDEEHLAIGIKFNLEAEGYLVTTLNEGAAVLQVIQDSETAVDLVILDIMLPGMSGYTICRMVREAGYDTPILLLSARTLPEDRARGFDVGANQYLTKPFDLDELLSRTKNLLKLPYRSAPPPVSLQQAQFGHTEVNFETYEATVDGLQVRLTKQEIKLLKYFVENEGRVIPRSELLEKIWGLPGHINTRAPDQFIRRLRKTFEPDPAQPKYFLTIRDAGYRFVSDTEKA
ncbi:MAG: response regulator transcription factor [Pirellulales bacterium]|jgi:two-component system OmpR family response regulator|nr:response regulator transcription factor [Pirellulales bacterium]